MSTATDKPRRFQKTPRRFRFSSKPLVASRDSLVSSRRAPRKWAWGAQENVITVPGSQVVVEVNRARSRVVAIVSEARAGDPEVLKEVAAIRRRARRRAFQRSDVVGIAEIASRARSKPLTVHQWKARYKDFPRPLVDLGWQAVWDWRDIEDFLKRHPRLGQRRKPR